MNKKRLSVTFEGQYADILDNLAKERGNKGEVLRDALALESIVVTATKRGAEVIIHEADGTLKQLVRV